LAEVVGYKEPPASYGDMFKDFIKNFRDEHGRFKYMERLRRMINFDLQSLPIDFSDLYRYNTELAEALIDNPSEVLREAGEAIRELVRLEDPEYAEKKKFNPTTCLPNWSSPPPSSFPTRGKILRMYKRLQSTAEIILSPS